jgi:hypothetical protein
VCTAPPGYAVENGLNNHFTSCSTTSNECMIECTTNDDCPPLVTCTADFANDGKVCLGPIY